ncbi:zinc finger MYM-type protein 2-like [Dysidea avara]|uniref:zinc finger MYM-type protein 2-like n=1 Tax=Dysidea avara TaxID=196820 RepID=UPI0033278B3C
MELESVSEADKEALYNFLGDELLPFISDEDTPTTGPTHLTEKELDELFFIAFEELEGASIQFKEVTNSSNKIVSNAVAGNVVQNERTTIAESTSGSSKVSSKAARKFAKPVTKEDIATTMQSAIPKKTQRDNKYCYTLWKEWVTHRAMATGEVIPLLCNITAEELQHWLCSFVLEVRKKNGDVFIPDTLYHICCGIMRYLRTNGMPHINIFKDPGFSQFQMVLDAEMKRLQSAGIGTVHRKAEPITCDEEEILWQKGILGDHTAEALLNTMVYMNGVYFSLRGGIEHRNLRYEPSQIKLFENPGEHPYLKYSEDVSKNHPGGLKGRKKKQKIVSHHANLPNPDRCFVRLYKLYNSRCPPNRPNNAFYLKPIKDAKKEMAFGTLTNQLGIAHWIPPLSEFASKLEYLDIAQITPSELPLLQDCISQDVLKSKK